jgi:LPXTG-motif cell wall-anchored protein
MPGPPFGAAVAIVVDDTQLVQELDENNNVCTTIYTPPSQIPTLTEWGLIIFGVVLLGFITWVFLRRRRAVVSLQ